MNKYLGYNDNALLGNIVLGGNQTIKINRFIFDKNIFRRISIVIKSIFIINFTNVRIKKLLYFDTILALDFSKSLFYQNYCSF